MDFNSKNGKAIIFSAPSGAGKTTIVHYLLGKFPNLSFSISATSREQRGSEINGTDYYFLEPEDFKTKIKNEELLECEEVYTDQFY
jgi:guanylate kinase